MYATHNAGKSVVTERSIRTSKTKIDKYMFSISKNMYVDMLSDIVNKYNNTYQSTIKMILVDVRSRTYIDFDKKNNKKDPKFKFGDHVRISEYKNIFHIRLEPIKQIYYSLISIFLYLYLFTYIIHQFRT